MSDEERLENVEDRMTYLEAILEEDRLEKVEDRMDRVEDMAGEQRMSNIEERMDRLEARLVCLCVVVLWAGAISAGWLWLA